MNEVAPQQMPRVSVVLPVYNRAGFLQQAFESIFAQTYTDWEIVVVDDGSTDNTIDVVGRLKQATRQPVRYFAQQNAGAYAARNTGVVHSRGEYIAFFDSDDYWLPHHLADCVAALDANPEVGWVYGAGRMVDLTTDEVLADNTFYVDGVPRPFLRLPVRWVGDLAILESREALRCQIEHGLYCGLQKSVLRRSIFEQLQFQPERRDESGKILTSSDDQIFVIRFLAAGGGLGYLQRVHVIYRVHEDNSSAAAKGSFDRQIIAIEQMIEGYARLPELVTLNAREKRALRGRLAGDWFWTLGYALFWQQGRRREALGAFRRGLGYWPWSVACWKTYLLARLRVWLAPDCEAGDVSEVRQTHA